MTADETSKPRARSKKAAAPNGAAALKTAAILSSLYKPANKASFDGVPAIRLINHSIADCGGI
jgi:hypothetical protein